MVVFSLLFLSRFSSTILRNIVYCWAFTDNAFRSNVSYFTVNRCRSRGIMTLFLCPVVDRPRLFYSLLLWCFSSGQCTSVVLCWTIFITNGDKIVRGWGEGRIVSS